MGFPAINKNSDFLSAMTCNLVPRSNKIRFESVVLLWFFYSTTNHLIVILLNYLWIFSFYATVLGLKLFDGELNDINGVPPVFINILGREYEIDRNIQAITGSLVVISYASALFLSNLYLT